MTISSKTNKSKVPLSFRQLDFHCSLNRPLRILQSGGHASITKNTVTRCEGIFIPILLGNSDPSIFALTSDSKVLLCRPAIPYIFPWVVLGTNSRYRHCILFSVVDAKSKSFFFFGDEENSCCSLLL